MNNLEPELIAFWSDGHVGHTDPKGVDIGKVFLKSIFLEAEFENSSPVKIYSHFHRTGNVVAARKFIERLALIFSKDQVVKRKKLYGYEHLKFKLEQESINIWYTSENLRPPLEENFDLFLSHDLDCYDGRNHYLPIWATRLGYNLEDSIKTQAKMTLPRRTSAEDRNGICAVISNPEPLRMAFIRQLQSVTKVDIYGALGQSLDDKAEVLNRYRFNICFENDEFPGYVTEKPFEAWEGGCIPIWRGIDKGKYINDQAIINVSKLGFQQSIASIQNILEDDEEYLRISSRPILQKEYDFNELIRKIQSTSIHKK